MVRIIDGFSYPVKTKQMSAVRRRRRGRNKLSLEALPRRSRLTGLLIERVWQKVVLVIVRAHAVVLGADGCVAGANG